MFTLHCTAKLRERLKRPLAATKRPSTTFLGDWYGTVLFWKPQLALLVNERTLMPILMPLAPASTLPERLGPAVAALLHQYGMALPLIERELAAMAEVDIAKTSNRRVVGTMNEFAFEAGVYRERLGADDLARLSMRLAETPCGAIGHNSPDRLFLEVVSRAMQ
jgi:hypothetical protein